MISGTTARATRAALFALVAVGTGTALHQIADGCSPGLFGPLLALPLVWLAALPLARRERSALVVTLALGLTQLGLHLELGLFCPKVPTLEFVQTGPAGTAHAGMPVMPGMSQSGHELAAMLAAHAVAVAVTGWWLGRGERAFFDVCRTLARLIASAAPVLSFASPAAGVVPSTVLRRFHVTAPRTARPPDGPVPGPRVLRGPPPALASR